MKSLFSRSLPKNLVAFAAVVALACLVGCAEKPKSPAPATKASEASRAPAAAFWPRFHGPNNDNISTEKGLLKKWPDSGPKLLWTAKGLGVGWSSVSIAGGRIYTAGDVDKKTPGSSSRTSPVPPRYVEAVRLTRVESNFETNASVAPDLAL